MGAFLCMGAVTKPSKNKNRINSENLEQRMTWICVTFENRDLIPTHGRAGSRARVNILTS